MTRNRDFSTEHSYLRHFKCCCLYLCLTCLPEV